MSADISTAISEGMKGAVGAVAAASSSATVTMGVEAPTAAIATAISDAMKGAVGAAATASTAAEVTVKIESSEGAQGKQSLSREHGGRRACSLVSILMLCCYTFLQFVFQAGFTMSYSL
jgi:hypothetical protein